MARLCKLCRTHTATIPDRDKGPAGRHLAEVCGPCYAGRLLEDLRRCMAPQGARRSPTCDAPLIPDRLTGYRCLRGCCP